MSSGPDRPQHAASLDVVDNPTGQRYEATVDGRVVAFAEYRTVRGRIVFFHTEVAPEVEGQGIGSRLAAGALDDVRRRGLSIGVRCPFIASYLKRHPEYADLVVDRGQRDARADQDG